jgi:hypothetical protein
VAAQLKILRVNHINQIVDDYDTAVAHLQDLFGGQFLREIGANPFTAGCLVDVGGEIIEVLAPKIMDKAEGKLLAKYGPHYQGIEIMVPSVSESLEIIKQRGIGVLLERDADFYTKPSATQGVCLQVYDGDWHADPPPAPYLNPMRTGQWWGEEHPIGYRGALLVRVDRRRGHLPRRTAGRGGDRHRARHRDPRRAHRPDRSRTDRGIP